MGLAEEVAKLSAEDFLKIAKGDFPPTEEMKYCEENGHITDEKTEWTSSRNLYSPIVHGFCKKCHRVYERNLTTPITL